MKISSSFLHFEHSLALDEKIKEVSARMEKYFDNKGVLKWRCYMENDAHFAEVNYSAPHCEFHAKGVSDSMYESIEIALEKVEKQVSKKKDRFNKLHQGNLRLVE